MIDGVACALYTISSTRETPTHTAPYCTSLLHIMGCGASSTAPSEPDDRIYCRQPGGNTEIRPGVDGIEEWEFSPVQVTVPDGTEAGMLISVKTPHGNDVEVVCPAGVAPGESFQALYYTSADELVNSVGTDWRPRSNNTATDAGGDRVPLHLCNSCGFGTKSQDCFKCGRRAADGGQRVAPACRDCVFGNAAKECAKCGIYFGDGPKHAAILCRSCSFGIDGRDRCAKCGQHCGAFRQL